jgi:hypothetical protein
MLWLGCVVAALLWSLLAWAAYGLVGWAGGLAASNADWVTAHPETVEWLSWSAAWLTAVGLAGVVAVWAIGAGLILFLPAALRFVRRAMRQRHLLAEDRP